MNRRILGLAFLFVTGTALAAAVQQPEPVMPNRLDPTAFPALAALIRGEMVRGGRFEFVKDNERQRVETSLDVIERALAGHQSVAELTEDDKVVVLTAQEEVNGILTKRDRDRLICERRPIVGSHFPQNVCESYGEKVWRTEQSKEQYRKFEEVILQKPVDVEDR